MLDNLLSLVAVLDSFIFTGYAEVLLSCRSRPWPCRPKTIVLVIVEGVGPVLVNICFVRKLTLYLFL